MNKISLAALGLLVFIIALGIVGRYDFASEVVQSMSETAYYTILDTLGDDSSEIEIAEEYMSNRAYYDSLK